MRYFLSILLTLIPLIGFSQDAHKCGFSEGGFAETRVTRSGDRDIPQFDETLLDESIVSPLGHFRIHFTRSGDNAVGGSETGTPQFVTEAALAADSAYTILVNNLGFLPPLPDNGIDGDELDIYIRDWNGSYYGMTYFGNTAPSMSYLVVDNDYIESSYATRGIPALQVTVAHEFFHMVQVRYAHPFDPVFSNAYWYEISSTWMEEKCYPDINDYHAYVSDNFRQASFPNLNDDRQYFAFSYGHSLFGQILDNEYGFNSDGKHIMLDIWEHLPGKEATDNLEEVLKSSRWNSTLTDALGEYAIYNVFTGSRAVNGMYYEDAAQLPEIHLKEYDLPTVFPADTNFYLDPFEISFRKFNIPTFSDFYVRGNALSADQRVFLTYHNYESGSSLKSAVGDYWIPCKNVSSLDYLIFPIVNGNRESSLIYTLSFEGSALELDTKIQALWPNPSILSLNPPQVSIMLESPGRMSLSIFNISGQTIYNEDTYRSDGIKLIPIELPLSTPAGIYFIRIITGNTVMSQKFTVFK